MKKCPSSIWRQDSNSQPSDYESPPLTTRPGLPPDKFLFITTMFSILDVQYSVPSYSFFKKSVDGRCRRNHGAMEFHLTLPHYTYVVLYLKARALPFNTLSTECYSLNGFRKCQISVILSIWWLTLNGLNRYNTIFVCECILTAFTEARWHFKIFNNLKYFLTKKILIVA